MIQKELVQVAAVLMQLCAVRRSEPTEQEPTSTMLTWRAEALPGARAAPGSRCSGWQVSHAYTVRACMSQVLILEPQRPHVLWLYTYLHMRHFNLTKQTISVRVCICWCMCVMCRWLLMALLLNVNKGQPMILVHTCDAACPASLALTTSHTCCLLTCLLHAWRRYSGTS